MSGRALSWVADRSPYYGPDLYVHYALAHLAPSRGARLVELAEVVKAARVAERATRRALGNLAGDGCFDVLAVADMHNLWTARAGVPVESGKSRGAHSENSPFFESQIAPWQFLNSKDIYIQITRVNSVVDPRILWMTFARNLAASPFEPMHELTPAELAAIPRRVAELRAAVKASTAP